MWNLFAIVILVVAGLCVLCGLLKMGRQARQDAGWNDPDVLPTQAKRST